ncbi:MAG: hypothetical protein JSS44_01945 [Proteobacteria bacterium]|nr:hypothetical protein [Pseudomonadota bacterium]MBS0462797.1 hypothetical protein [Pseudomonadota bacterium]MBS0463807.1 hypothetical protein [Pseudomonadota bacterium]
MNTMKWLLKREYWEHKGGFFWAPLIVGAIMLLFLTVSVVTVAVTGSHHIGCHLEGGRTICLSQSMTPTQRDQFVHGLASGYVGLETPVYFVLPFTMFFFALGCLFDDRKDRSVLFWKSLPISDHATVVSKLAMVLLIAPLLTIAIGTVLSLLSLLVICLAGAVIGLNFFGALLSPDIVLSPLTVVAMLPVYAAWALPTIGWLMLVSAWARTKPFLWAVGVPVLAGTLLSWGNALFGLGWNDAWYWQHIVGRGLGGTVPGLWFAYHPHLDGILQSVDGGPAGMVVDSTRQGIGWLLAQSWQMFATPGLWIGVAVGAAMIYAAIRLRRWRDEG